MLIDWEDNKKRTAFRLALERAYPSEVELRMFVDGELNLSLAVIAGNDNLRVTAFKLINWAISKGKIDDVFAAFCRENQDNKAVAKAIAELQQQSPLIERSSNLGEEDWQTLFEQFSPYDFADIHRAFQQGFQGAFKVAFRQIVPDHPSLTGQAQIQELLARYDDPELAIWFVESVIVEFQRSSATRDLADLRQWRDRIAQKYNVPPFVPKPISKSVCQAYLLIALGECGSDINGYAELRITDREDPIPFASETNPSSKNGPINEILDWISKLIPQAENALDLYDDVPQVILEVFLPLKYLGVDIASTWMIKDEDGEEIGLGTHRYVVVRSFDRISKSPIQKMLKQAWARLQDCGKVQNGCAHFHIQENCLEGVDLKDLPAAVQDNKATGLKLLAKLPDDSEKREALLKGITKVAVPIALWPSATADADANNLKTEFDALLEKMDLTNFADLAQQLRKRRRSYPLAKHIRLLCDRPDRLPKLPDIEIRPDDDAIVGI